MTKKVLKLQPPALPDQALIDACEQEILNYFTLPPSFLRPVTPRERYRKNFKRIFKETE